MNIQILTNSADQQRLYMVAYAQNFFADWKICNPGYFIVAGTACINFRIAVLLLFE